MVVRNIPARYTQARLLQEWPPDGTYDLLHLPFSFREKRTLGFAFLNMKSHELAVAFQNRWHGKYLTMRGRTKHLDVTAASVQGLEANLLQLQGRNIDQLINDDFLPAVFDGTTRLNTRDILARLVARQGSTTSRPEVAETAEQDVREVFSF